MDHTLEKSSVGGGQPRAESDANTATRNTRNSDFTGAQGSQLQTTHDHISNRPSNQQKDTSVNQRASNHHEEASEHIEHGTRQNVFTLGRTEVTNNTSEVVSKYTELLGTRIQNPVTHVGTGSYNTSFGAALSRPAIRQSGLVQGTLGSNKDFGLLGSSSSKMLSVTPTPIPISTGSHGQRVSQLNEVFVVNRGSQLPRVGSDSALPFVTRLDSRSKYVTGQSEIHRQQEHESRSNFVHQTNSGLASPPPESQGAPMFRVSHNGGVTNTTSTMQGGTRTTMHTTVYPGRVTTNETLYEHPPVVKSYLERPSVVYAPSVTSIPAPRVVVSGQPFVTGGYATVTERVVSSGSLRDSHIGHSSAVKTTTSSSTVNQSEFLSTIQRQKEQIEELQAKLQKSESHESSLTASLRRTVETLQTRQTDLEDKLKKTSLERDELLFKLEGREDAQGSLKERLVELESELRVTKAKSQRIEGDLASITAERTELQATIRKLQSEHSSRQLSSDMNSNEALNRLKISEERCRHLEKRNLDLEDELLKIAREFKEFRERAGANDRSTVVRPVLTGLDGIDQQTYNSVLAQLKEKTLLAEEYKLKFESAEQRAIRAEKALADLQRQLDSERANFQTQLQQKESDKRNLKTKLEDLQTKFEELNSQMSAQKSLVENLTRQLEAAKSRLKSVEDENDHLKKERTALMGEKKQLELKCQGLELENQRLQRALENKTQEAQRLEVDCHNKQEKINGLSKNLSDAQQLISDLQAKIKQLESALSRLERELEGKATPEEISAPLQAEIARLEELLRALREEMKNKIDEFELRIEEYDMALLKAEEKINSLNKQVEDLEAAKNKAEDDLLSLQEVSEKFICDNHTLQAERDALREEVLMLQEQLEHQGGMMLDSELMAGISLRIQKLLDIIRAKDQEIQDLYRLADSATRAANERLFEVETAHQQHAKSVNNVALAFEELSKVGIKQNFDPMQQTSAR